MRRNRENARQKKYHHRLGACGYKSAIPKCESMEGALVAKGIRPCTMDWPELSRNWFYGHGGTLDLEIGVCIFGERIQTTTQRHVVAIDASA